MSDKEYVKYVVIECGINVESNMLECGNKCSSLLKEKLLSIH